MDYAALLDLLEVCLPGIVIALFLIFAAILVHPLFISWSSRGVNNDDELSDLRIKVSFLKSENAFLRSLLAQKDTVIDSLRDSLSNKKECD